MGFVTPIGNERSEVAANLRAGRHGLSPVEFFGNPGLPVKVAGRVRGFEVESPHWREWTWPARYTFPRETVRSLAPHGVYALCAVEQALADAGLTPSDIARNDDTGLFCASAGSAMLLHHHLSQLHAVRGERANPLGVVSSIAGTLNFNLAAHFQITGTVCGYVSACASSTHAIGYAVDDLRLGRLRRAIIVGAEELNAETLLPFGAMRALSNDPDPARASRPFDRGRDGFVGSGGAAAIVLERVDAPPSGAPPTLARGYARIAGWGQAADGHSVAMSHPEGAGLLRAMRRALADGEVPVENLDYVNAHATSTPVGDRAEALALKSLLGERRPPVSSTKGLTGHPLSMAGIMETAFCAVAMRDGFIPGNPHLKDADPACEGLHLPTTTLDQRPRCILKNSSGFGGSNVCLVLQSLD